MGKIRRNVFSVSVKPDKSREDKIKTMDEFCREIGVKVAMELIQAEDGGIEFDPTATYQVTITKASPDDKNQQAGDMRVLRHGGK